DGLQRACNRLVIASLPWTNAEYEQLVGRINRQGQDSEVEVLIPQIEYREIGGRERVWSRDQVRMQIITRKRTLMDCVIDGVIPTRDIESDRRKTRRALHAWVQRLENGDIAAEAVGPPLQAPAMETEEHRRQRSMNEFKVMNRIWSTMRS